MTSSWIRSFLLPQSTSNVTLGSCMPGHTRFSVDPVLGLLPGFCFLFTETDNSGRPVVDLSGRLVAATGLARQRPEGLSHGCRLFRERLLQILRFSRWRIQLNMNLLTTFSAQVHLCLGSSLSLPLLLITPTPLLLLSGFPLPPDPHLFPPMLETPTPLHLRNGPLRLLRVWTLAVSHFFTSGTTSCHDVLSGVSALFCLPLASVNSSLVLCYRDSEGDSCTWTPTTFHDALPLFLPDHIIRLTTAATHPLQVSPSPVCPCPSPSAQVSSPVSTPLLPTCHGSLRSRSFPYCGIPIAESGGPLLLSGALMIKPFPRCQAGPLRSFS